MSSVEKKLTLIPQCLLRVCDAEDIDVTSVPGKELPFGDPVFPGVH